VLSGGKVAPPPKPEGCTPAEASLCFTTSSFATTVSKGVTKTTSTQVKSTCATITGCNLKDVEHTKSVEKCALTKRHVEPVAVPQETGRPAKRAVAPNVVSFPSFFCESDGQDGFVFLNNARDSQARANVIAVLDQRAAIFKVTKKQSGYTEFRANNLGYTAFFVVRNMGPVLLKYFNSNSANYVSGNNLASLVFSSLT
jgi:chitinase